MSRGPGSKQWMILQACVIAADVHARDTSRWWINLRSLLPAGSTRSDWASLQRAARRLSITGGRYYQWRNIDYKGGRKGIFIRLQPQGEALSEEQLIRAREREVQRRLAALRDLPALRELPERHIPNRQAS
ncbi:MAG: hypothetical protein AB7P33_12965 [Dehalococcoidia bacterium]